MSTARKILQDQDGFRQACPCHFSCQPESRPVCCTSCFVQPSLWFQAIPCAVPLPGSSSVGDPETQEATPQQAAQQDKAIAAVLRASASASGPRNGIVAVKVTPRMLCNATQTIRQI